MDGSRSRVWWYDAMGCESTDTACLQRWNAVHIAAIVPSVLSIVASICIIVIGITYHRRLSSLGFCAQLPIFISLCDLGFELSHGSDHAHNLATGFVSEGALCQFFGCLKPFFINAQTTWALGVAFFLNRSVLAKSVAQTRPQYGPHNVYLHAFCWGVPLVILVCGFAFDVYGVEGPWCGITDPATDFWMVDVWMLLTIAVLVVNYAWIIIHVYNVMKKSEHDTRNSYRKTILRALPIMGLFPVAYAVQWIFFALFKLHVLTSTYGNVLLVVISANMGGIYNFALYGRMLFNNVRRELHKQNKASLTYSPLKTKTMSSNSHIHVANSSGNIVPPNQTYGDVEMTEDPECVV